MARALRYHIGARPAGRDDAAAHVAAVAFSALPRSPDRARPARLAFPPALAVSAAGAERRISDGRPVEPLRLFRGAADRLLWADPARSGKGEIGRAHV